MKSIRHWTGVASLGIVALFGARSWADVEVAYHRPPPTFGNPPEEVLRQHGERIRIDSRSVMEPSGIVLVRQKFTAPGQAASFELRRFEDGRLAFLSIMDDPLAAPPLASARRFTGETENRLGERCRVWRVENRTASGNAFIQAGCVTAEGVDLWRRQDDIDAIFATKVTRVRVPPSDVRVPTEALDLATWAPTRPADHTHDYEVEFGWQGPQWPRLTARRSGPWRFVREVRGAAYNVTVTNADEGVGLNYYRERNGVRHLSIYRRPGPHAPFDEATGVRISGRPDETILGETCHWWDIMAGLEDAGRLECRTADGVPLKVVYIQRGDELVVVAVRLKRERQPLSAVMPTHDISSPSAWGFGRVPSVDQNAAAQQYSTCHRADLSWTKGRKLDPAMQTRMQAAVGAKGTFLIKPDGVVIPEWASGRLNVRLDADGKIADAYCGSIGER